MGIDKIFSEDYNDFQNNRQFETILSLNKTMEKGWGQYLRPFLRMRNRNKIRILAHGAILAALYAVLTHLQNALLPGSASWAVQFRLSEALCVLALFTPGAVWGLPVGCFLFNLTYAGALPLDMVVGSFATFLACGAMYLTRRWNVAGYPALAMVMPALCNALLVGWELTVYIGGGFWLNALYVGLGELAVMLIPGSALYWLIRARRLDQRIFSETGA